MRCRSESSGRFREKVEEFELKQNVDSIRSDEKREKFLFTRVDHQTIDMFSNVVQKRLEMS